MAPPTRASSRKAEKPNDKSKPKTGISKKEAAGAALARQEQIQEQFARIQDRYDKGDETVKGELENQRNLLEKQKQIVRDMETPEPTDMDVDSAPNEPKTNQPESEQPDSKEHATNENSPKPARVKFEEQEEGDLFISDKDEKSEGEGLTGDLLESVSGNKPDTPAATTESVDDGDDDIGLVRAFGDLSLEPERGELEKYFKGNFGQYYGVYRHGPKNAARYTIDYIAKNNELPEDIGKNALLSMDSQSLAGKETSNGRYARKGTIHRVLGVAWDHVGQHGRMSSLARSNWPTERNSSRRRPPTMKVMVRWFDDQGPESWEKFATVKIYMYVRAQRDTFVVPQTIKYDDITILEEGEEMHRADFLIIKTAVQLEKRHREYTDGDRRSEDRDPTPGLPLLSDKKVAGQSKL